MNTLYFGDNLEVMREMDDQRVDLICTDPPFNSRRDYNAFLTDSRAQSKAFTDTWTWDDPTQDARTDIERLARASDTYKIHGYPTNMQEVHMLVRDERKYHDFSNWAVTRLGLQPTKSVGDAGKDGEAHVGHITLWDPETTETTDARILAEVKSGKPTINQVRAFCRVMDKNDAIGIFITIEPVSAGMRQEAADMGTFYHNNETFPRLQFWQIDDTYFENPSSLRNLIRLPQQSLEPMRKIERHFTDKLMTLLRS